MRELWRLPVFAAVLALIPATAAMAITPSQANDPASCQMMFNELDKNMDGTIGGPEVAELTFYVGASHSGRDTELTITNERFMDDCVNGAFVN